MTEKEFNRLVGDLAIADDDRRDDPRKVTRDRFEEIAARVSDALEYGYDGNLTIDQQITLEDAGVIY